jgi:O-antigen ligase
MVEQPVRESWIAAYGARIVGPKFFQAKFFEIGRWERAADFFAAGIAIWLPWSTSLTWVFIGLWLFALIPTLDGPGLRRVLAMPAGGLPVLLWLLALIGVLWATGVPMTERWGGLSSLFKLLAIPLLMFQFQRSTRASWVMIGFLASCGVLLIVSWAIVLLPSLPMHWTQREGFGVPVRDYIAQTGEFAACIFLLAGIALQAYRQQRRSLALAHSLAALLFLANLFVISTSRTGLVVIPFLLLLFLWRHVDRRRLGGVLVAAAAVGIVGCLLAPNVRNSVVNLVDEVRSYNPSDTERTRAGERLEFWRKSIGFLVDAPILGHGTGSIPDQFRRAALGQAGMASIASTNPHNQIFGVAIQLGFVGTAVVVAMWLAHLMLFRGEGLAVWAGLVVVAENVLSSLFNSHLFDFTQGWGYALGVGVAAGAVLRQVSHRRAEKAL